MTIKLYICGMANQEPLNSAGDWMQAGKRGNFTLDQLPLIQRINQQAGLIGINGCHQGAALTQYLPETRRYRQTPFDVYFDGINTAKHDAVSLLEPILLDNFLVTKSYRQPACPHAPIGLTIVHLTTSPMDARSTTRSLTVE